jgi:hypothetical protein
MAGKALGTADITAHRIGGVTTLTATGTFPNLNDKADFAPLPFLIFPPMWAFYVVSANISLPATRPFTYSETIAFPADANVIRVQTATGFQSVSIVDVVLPTAQSDTAAATALGDYSVYKWIGLDTLMIAPSDAIVPAVYVKVFGPASHEDCEKYVAENKGS